MITDNPKRFLEVCDEWEHGKKDIRFDRKQWFFVIWLNSMILVFRCIFFWRYGTLPGGKPTRRPKWSQKCPAASGPGVFVEEPKDVRYRA